MPEPTDLQGSGSAALILAHALFVILVRRGVITAEEAHEFVDIAMIAAEQKAYADGQERFWFGVRERLLPVLNGLSGVSDRGIG